MGKGCPKGALIQKKKREEPGETAPGRGWTKKSGKGKWGKEKEEVGRKRKLFYTGKELRGRGQQISRYKKKKEGGRKKRNSSENRKKWKKDRKGKTRKQTTGLKRNF